jgi:predicted house-cleaning noncanonical NTP pyrophosphatase (MazG superfamily)
MINPAEHFLRAPNLRAASHLVLASKETAGGKGAGLIRLPLAWYPPTMVIAPTLWTVTGQKIRVADLATVVTLVHDLGNLAAESHSGKLLLRSNAQDESIADRGTYLSVTIEPTLEGLAGGISQIWDDAGTKSNHPMGLLVQPALETLRAGHLSNEHRISRASTQWLLGTYGEAQQRWQVQQAMGATDEELLARNPTKSDYQLRAVAKRLSGQPSRMHLEWLWDGSRTWVVQADPCPPRLGPPPGEGFVNVLGSKVSATALKEWEHLSDNPDDGLLKWPKILAIAEFREADLGGSEFWILNGSKVTTSNGAGLLGDLELLCSGHILIRTDVRGEKLQPNLKRSDVLIDAAAALTHLYEVTSNYVAEGGHPADLCFIAHRFTRARASAWAAAWPNRADVRIDSLWGLADGLQYLPHDTAWVNADNGDIQQRNINGKTDFLETSDGDDWDYQPTPTEWIWKGSVTQDQLVTIATSTQRVANLRGKPVVVLWFVGVLGGYDADCLAWVTSEGPKDIPVDLRNHARYPRCTVTSVEELEAFAPTEPNTVLRLEPEKDLIRENSFLQLVAAKAKEFDVTVEMDGSPLAHAYYQLSKAGITVVCLDSPEQPTREFNKLVRDNIVSRVQEQGERVVSYQASPQEQRVLLKRKLVEEAIEVLDAEGEGALLEELADVEEVLTALREALGIDRGEVVEVQERKRSSRGGFSTNSVLIKTGGSETDVYPELFSTTDMRRMLDHRQVDATDNQVTFSLVPPSADRRLPFLIRIGNVILRARYDNSELVVNVSTVRIARNDEGALEGLFPAD